MSNETAVGAALPKRVPALEHLPIGLFGMVMGLAGTTLATERAAHLVGGAASAALAALALAFALFTAAAACAVFGLYGLKIARHAKAVSAEWHHPVRINFFPAASIALILLATMLLPHAPEAARVLWLVGVSAQAVGFVGVVASWIGPRTIPIMALNPAWFIPAVGNVVVPIAGVPLGYGQLSWLFFGVGITFWLLLLPMVIHRFVFEAPLMPRMLPTLAILVAPPAVAFLAYLRLAGGMDGAAHVLYAGALAFAALVLAHARDIARAPFGVPWWALSFPSAAFTIATLTYGERTGSALAVVAGLALWTVLLALIALLLARTVRAHLRGELLVPEPPMPAPPTRT